MLLEDIKQFNKRYLLQLVEAVHTGRFHAENCYHLGPDVLSSLMSADPGKLEQYAEQSQTVLGSLYLSLEEVGIFLKQKRKAPTVEFKSINLNYLFLVRSLALGDLDQAIVRLCLPLKTLEVIKNLSFEDLQALACNVPYSLLSCRLSGRALSKLNEIHQYLLRQFSMLASSNAVQHAALV